MLPTICARKSCVIAHMTPFFAFFLTHTYSRKKKLTSVDKANVLACSRLWRKTVTRVIKEEFPEITLDHQYVDACAMHMIRRCVERTTRGTLVSQHLPFTHVCKFIVGSLIDLP